MKVFFHAPINETDSNDNKNYFNHIKSLGYTQTTEFAVMHSATEMLDPKLRKKAKNNLHEQEIAIKKADIIVLGANSQSIGTGLFMGLAMRLSKPVIALCKDRDTMPYFYEAVDYNKLIICECTPDNYTKNLPRALKQAKKLIDKRFTLLLPPDVVEMLDNHYIRTGETRSEYIRELIKEDQTKRAANPQPSFSIPRE